MSHRRLIVAGLCALCGIVWMVMDMFSGLPWQGVGILVTSLALACLVAGFTEWNGAVWELAAGIVVLCGFMHMMFETNGTDMQRQARQNDLAYIFLKLSSAPNDYGLTQAERDTAQQGMKACFMQPYSDMQQTLQAGNEAIHMPMEAGFFERLWQSLAHPFSTSPTEKSRVECLDIYEKLHASKPELLDSMENQMKSMRGPLR